MNAVRTPIVVLAVLALAELLEGNAAASDAPPFQLPRVVEGTLDNGMKVLVCPRPGTGLVDVRVALRVGAWLEGEFEGSGISHYYEHVVAGGTTSTRTADDAKKLLRTIGGQMQARTDADRTWFGITTTPDGMATAVDLLSDWMQHASLKDEDVTREKGVILNELAQYADQAPRRAWELVHSIAFTRHPARLPTQGARAAFEALTRTDLVKFYDSHYVPGNAVVAVVGDVDAGRAFNAVREAFSNWKRAHVPDPPEPETLLEPPIGGRRFAATRLAAPRTAVALAWPTVQLRHPDKPALDVLRTLLGNGHGARLVKRLSEAQGATATATVWSRTPALGGGLFLVLGDVPADAEGRAVEFEKLVLAEIERVAKDGVTDEEVDRAARRIRSDSLVMLDSVSELAQTLSRDHLQSGDCRFEERYQAGVARVTAADVKRVAARYLTPDNLAVAVVGPNVKDAAPAAPTQAARAEADVATLSNGVRVIVEPRPDDASSGVVVAAAIGGGPLRETLENSGVSSVLAELLARGGRPNVEAALAEVEKSGGAVATNVSPFAMTITVRVLPGDAPLALRYLGLALSSQDFDAATVKAEIARAKGRADARSAAFVENAIDRLFATVYGGTPFALPPYGGSDSLAVLPPEAVAKFARAALVGGNVAVVVSGAESDGTAAAAVAKDALGAIAAGPALAMPEPARPLLAGPEGVARRTTVDVERAQATVLLAWPGAAIDAEEPRIALDLVDAYWSGRTIASGPLFDALRGGTADLVYYVQGEHRALPGGGLFFTIAQCAPDRAVEVEKAMRDAAAALAKNGLTADDLKVAANVLLADRTAAQQTLEARARTRAAALLIGRPLDAEARYRERSRAIGLDAVNAAAKSLGSEPFVLVLWPKGVARQ